MVGTMNHITTTWDTHTELLYDGIDVGSSLPLPSLSKSSKFMIEDTLLVWIVFYRCKFLWICCSLWYLLLYTHWPTAWFRERMSTLHFLHITRNASCLKSRKYLSKVVWVCQLNIRTPVTCEL